MHIETEIKFASCGDPVQEAIDIRRDRELLYPFLEYLLGVDIDSDEYKDFTKKCKNASWMKVGYFHALRNLSDYWKKYGDHVKTLKLCTPVGIDFLINKLIEYKHQFFDFGADVDIPIKSEEIENLKACTKKTRWNGRK